MKIKPGDAERFCRKPDAKVRAVLVYGPDEGLVRERAQALIASVVDDPQDPFRIAELTPATLREEPGRLFDEAAAIAMLGGRRVVRVRGAGDALADLFEQFFADAAGDTLVVVEAGDLSPRGLRRAFEEADNATALACYRDEAGQLRTLIETTLREHGNSAEPAAVDWLMAHLGNDRQITRGELEKLTLYLGKGGRATLEDVVAAVGDNAERTQDDLADAVGAGDLKALQRDLARAADEGASPISLLRAVARHLQRLHFLAGQIEGGARAADAVKRLRPPVFWKAAEGLARQATRWSPARLGWALQKLLEAEAACKRTGAPASLIAERTLMEIAARSGRRS